MILLLILLSTVFATNAKYICTVDHYVNLEFNKVVFFESPDFPRIMTDDEIKQCFINFTEAMTTEKESKQFVIVISNSICFDVLTGIYDCNSDYEVFTNKTSVFFDKNSFTYNYIAFQGYSYFNDGDDNYPLESVSRVQPFQLTDITEIIEIRSTYPTYDYDPEPRNQSCIWKFKAPEDWGFKIFINGLHLNNDTIFKVENSQEIIIEANGNGTSNLEIGKTVHYSADNYIKIYLSKTNFSTRINYELSAYITIIKTLLNHVPINSSVTTNGSSVIWSYSNEFGIPNNAKCKFILKILPKTEKEILVKLNKMESEYLVDMIYYSYDSSISNGDDKIYFGNDYAFANDGKTEKELLFEFRSDGSIQSKAFEVEFITKNCSCADSLITVPCIGVVHTYLMKNEIDSTNRDFYCGNLKCNFTIMLNSTCASPFIVLSLSFDSNPAENDTFRVISNNKTICDPSYIQNSCRIPSSNLNVFQTITSSSSLVNARYLTIELSASNISTYLPTFVINETKPYYFHDPLFTTNGETPYMILIKLSSELRQRNATIDVFLFNDDPDLYDVEYDLGFYQDTRLTNQIDFRNCFTAITYGVLKCKTNLESVAFVLFDTIPQGTSFLFQVTKGDKIIGTEGCVFKNNVFYLNRHKHKDENLFSVLSNRKQKCRIFCYSVSHFIIQRIWISPNSNGTFSIFSGSREKLLVNIDARSASMWHNFITFENIYVMEIPLNSFAMLTGYGNVLFEDPINITNKPYKTVLTTPFYGSSNIISYPIYYDGCSGDPYRMFNILENKVQFTVLDTDFLLPNYFYFVLNKTTYINMTTDSILFGPSVTVEIGCSCLSNVNCNIRMLLETINFIEANTTTTLKPSTTTNALTTTDSLKANDKSFSFILTVNYFLLIMNGII